VKTFARRAIVSAALATATCLALAQDVQERVIKFGHLNNTDHPVSMGVKKFAELLAAKSGGKLKVQEFPSNQLGNELQSSRRTSWATNCSSSRRCRAACRRCRHLPPPRWPAS